MMVQHIASYHAADDPDDVGINSSSAVTQDELDTSSSLRMPTPACCAVLHIRSPSAWLSSSTNPHDGNVITLWLHGRWMMIYYSRHVMLSSDYGIFVLYIMCTLLHIMCMLMLFITLLGSS